MEVWEMSSHNRRFLMEKITIHDRNRDALATAWSRMDEDDCGNYLYPTIRIILHATVAVTELELGTSCSSNNNNLHH